MWQCSNVCWPAFLSSEEASQAKAMNSGVSQTFPRTHLVYIFFRHALGLFDVVFDKQTCTLSLGAIWDTRSTQGTLSSRSNYFLSQWGTGQGKSAVSKQKRSNTLSTHLSPDPINVLWGRCVLFRICWPLGFYFHCKRKLWIAHEVCHSKITNIIHPSGQMVLRTTLKSLLHTSRFIYL